MGDEWPNTVIPKAAAGMHLNASYKITMNPQIDDSVQFWGVPRGKDRPGVNPSPNVLRCVDP